MATILFIFGQELLSTGHGSLLGDASFGVCFKRGKTYSASPMETLKWALFYAERRVRNGRIKAAVVEITQVRAMAILSLIKPRRFVFERRDNRRLVNSRPFRIFQTTGLSSIRRRCRPLVYIYSRQSCFHHGYSWRPG